MESRVLNCQRFFKALALLIVFLVFFSIPVMVAFNIEEDARNIRIRMDMNQLKNWAEVYRLTNKSYQGFENDPDLSRVFEDIKSMKGEVNIFVSENNDSYCSRVFFRKGSFCIDDSGYTGKDDGNCSSTFAKCN